MVSGSITFRIPADSNNLLERIVRKIGLHHVACDKIPNQLGHSQAPPLTLGQQVAILTVVE
jgi:hypothetical protein